MRTRIAAIVPAIVVALGLALVPATATAQGPDWGDCPEQADPRQQCALLTVPLDYSNPGGGTIEIAVSRIPAEDPARRRGVLLFNPGGPGERGLFDPSGVGQDLPDDVRAQYDLIGFDPRGIGYSAPVTCALAPEDQDVLQLLPYPAADLDISENVAYSQRAAVGCAANSADLLPHITTANTARDMDEIRGALGDERISFLGYSYGTYLGAVYAELFPQRTDRFVLDSNVHPGRIWRSTFYAWGPALEVAVPPFYRFAAENHATYGLGETPAEVRAKGLELIAELEAEPFEHPLLGFVDHRQFREWVRVAMRHQGSFPELALIWMLVDERELDPASEARAGGAAAALREAGAPDRAPAVRSAAPPQFPVPPDDNPYVSLWAVTCGDADWPESPATYQRDVRVADRLFPIVGGMGANIWPCAFWPFDPRDPVVDVGRLDGGNVLITQSVRDPATPLDGALALRLRMGSRSRLVTTAFGGHSIAFRGSSACLDQAAGSFLATGELPTRDVFCPAEEPPADTVGPQSRRALEQIAEGGALGGN
jgi:pimeloyl-ACP methyl ester carboxylesterase